MRIARAWEWLDLPSIYRFDLRWTFRWRCADRRFACEVVWHPNGVRSYQPCMDHHDQVQRHYLERMARAQCPTCGEIPRSAYDKVSSSMDEIPAGFDAWAEHAERVAEGLWKEPRRGQVRV